MNGLADFLNPANWVKGVHTVSDAVVLFTHIATGIFVLLLVYLIVFKIIVPIISLCVCPQFILCPTSSKK